MYLFLDTETHSETDPIMIQLGYKASDKSEYFTQLYGTGGVPITFSAMAVHHITESEITGKSTFSDSPDADTMRSLLSDHILVAHNAQFDMNVLARAGVTTPRSICTLRLSRHLFPDLEQHKLQYLRYYFGVEFATKPQTHDALGDVLVLEKVFQHLYEKLQKAHPEADDKALAERMIEISSHPSILYLCKFGKHKGTLWSEVPMDYLNWVVNKSDFTDEDVLYTARYYLER